MNSIYVFNSYVLGCKQKGEKSSENGNALKDRMENVRI